MSEQQVFTPQSAPDSGCSWDWSAEITNAMHSTRIRRAFRDHLLRYATAESDVPAAELIFGELLANVVRHAHGAGSFKVDWRDLRPTLLVLDRGTGFPKSPDGTFADPIAEESRGLALVRTFAVETLIGNCARGGAYVSVILPVRRLGTKG